MMVIELSDDGAEEVLVASDGGMGAIVLEGKTSAEMVGGGSFASG